MVQIEADAVVADATTTTIKTMDNRRDIVTMVIVGTIIQATITIAGHVVHVLIQACNVQTRHTVTNTEQHSGIA